MYEYLYYTYNTYKLYSYYVTYNKVKGYAYNVYDFLYPQNRIEDDDDTWVEIEIVTEP